MKDFAYLKSLTKLKPNSRIYIYGSGSFGLSFYFSIKAYRPDIHILGFLESSNSGEIFSLPIIKTDDFSNFRQNYDNIIICTDPMHWSAIVNKLNEVDLKSYLVNLYWDFDVYGKKDLQKYGKYKHLTKKIRNLFNFEEDKNVWDIITFSMSKHNIEKSYEYWDKHKVKTDYCKYMKLNDGDVVINGGSAFGNDNQFFSEQVGDNGIVCAFDLNIGKNNIKSKSIKIIPKVLWDKTTKVSFLKDGSRSRVIDRKKGVDVRYPSITIDDFVNNQHLNRLDFIKLDVEGAEMNVLKGGVDSILKFRPGLAISIYHKLEDFFEIPLFIDELLTDYVYHIECFSPYCIDTILFAVPIERE